jgi:hypothetical protein
VSVIIVIYTCKVDVCKKNEGKWLSRRVLMCSSLVMTSARAMMLASIVDVDTMTNTDYCMRQYLSLFISDCQKIICSFLAPILGFIRDHRDHRIPLLPAAQPRVWGKFCLFVLCLVSFGLIRYDSGPWD